jgi:hypothetical protein
LRFPIIGRDVCIGESVYDEKLAVLLGNDLLNLQCGDSRLEISANSRAEPRKSLVNTSAPQRVIQTAGTASDRVENGGFMFVEAECWYGPARPGRLLRDGVDAIIELIVVYRNSQAGHHPGNMS